MLDITLKEIRNVFIATIDLVTKPKSCFNKEENGDLSVASISGFKYWFYLTLLSYILVLISSNSSDYYSTWYFISSGIYALLRMLLVALIWVIVGKILKFSNTKYLISLLFFQVGFFSFFLFILLFPLLYKVGLEALLSTDVILVKDLVKENKIYILFVSGIYVFFTMFYSITWLGSVFNKNKLIILLFLLSTSFFYGLSREYIVLPMVDWLVDYLNRSPWIVPEKVALF